MNDATARRASSWQRRDAPRPPRGPRRPPRRRRHGRSARGARWRRRCVATLRRRRAVSSWRTSPSALFAATVPAAARPLRDRDRPTPTGRRTALRDPYAFAPTLGELDLHLIAEGRHEELWRALGRPSPRDRRRGGRRVRGLGARGAVGQRRRRLQRLGRRGRTRCARSAAPGIWELFVPGVADGARYKFEIRGPDGALRLKADPMARGRRGAAADRLGRRPQSHHRWRDDGVDGGAPGRAAVARADVDLRGAPRLVAPQPAARATGR